jgi:hypothetical protein
MTNTADPLAHAKQRLPLPQLMAALGDAAHAKRSCRCPFHEDRRNSFSLFQWHSRGWFWKCHAGCGHGDAVDYLKLRFNLSTCDAIRRYCELAGVCKRNTP